MSSHVNQIEACKIARQELTTVTHLDASGWRVHCRPFGLGPSAAYDRALAFLDRLPFTEYYVHTLRSYLIDQRQSRRSQPRWQLAPSALGLSVHNSASAWALLVKRVSHHILERCLRPRCARTCTVQRTVQSGYKSQNRLAQNFVNFVQKNLYFSCTNCRLSFSQIASATFSSSASETSSTYHPKLPPQKSVKGS